MQLGASDSERVGNSVQHVSILTRPGGRVQPTPDQALLYRSMRSRFQSSPDPEAGCNPTAIAIRRCCNPTPLFQSSPDPEAGCNDTQANDLMMESEFQSSPDPEAGCNHLRRCHVAQESRVSILTRP